DLPVHEIPRLEFFVRRHWVGDSLSDLLRRGAGIPEALDTPERFSPVRSGLHALWIVGRGGVGGESRNRVSPSASAANEWANWSQVRGQFTLTSRFPRS